MGWKALKEHYRIGHLVQVVPDKGICIGSPYIHDILVVSLAGELVKRDRPGRGWSVNSDLARYQAEMDADPAKLKQLVGQADEFTRSVTVFTYEGAEIIECACEELGWPNVTHDGRMMFENTFSQDRDQVIDWAIRNARGGIEGWSDNVARRQAELREAQEQLARCTGNLNSLLPLIADRPSVQHDGVPA